VLHNPETIYYAVCLFLNSYFIEYFRRYQAIIWGSIGGAIVLALIVFLYLKSDNYDCEGPILYKYVLCWYVP